MFLTHSLFSNGKSQSMDMSLRCVHALCPFMWYYGKGVVASCLGYNWHRIQEVLPVYWHAGMIWVPFSPVTMHECNIGGSPAAL